ncbi:MAG TPA: ribosome small subunit-dependent GTPase A [Tepidisphaeraceae bacterium]|nr:ribosome small subunit-dependent GTPase A [Tepidisphaeraceae bacterium]
MDEDRIDASQRFSDRNKNAQKNKTLKTAQQRQDNTASSIDIDGLPLGRVIQVYSLYCDVHHEATTYLCTIRKTLAKVSETAIVVGDYVRFRTSGKVNGNGQPEGVVERADARRTVVTRADSFKQIVQHPVVANADQMLIVAAVANPRPKWGLIDRLLIAATSGGLRPVLCLNKVDLTEAEMAFIESEPDPDEGTDAAPPPHEALAYYASIGVATLGTSVTANVGLEALSAVLANQITVLAGHSGVGKSSLIRAIQPHLNIRVGDVSLVTEKGRHTTTSARYYPLEGSGGAVIDTPGVKVFGLWGVTRDNLLEHFPDVADDTAPEWRRLSYERIAESLKE